MQSKIEAELDIWSKIAQHEEAKLHRKNGKAENHSHAWRGTWDRPVHIDEDQAHPFTIARMTDHNVRGHDSEKK